MRLILTHEKSDFDAIASQLAAHKLYPEAVPLLSRHQNRNVQQFLNLYWDALPFVSMVDWRRQRVDQVLLVDTNNVNNVRGMVKEPEVHVVDHHLDYTPRPGWHYQVEPVGATTTLLVEKLQAAGLSLSLEEATLLLLGVFEDTGSLMYDTATARDARAAAWLFEQNAQLDVVRRFLTIPLTPAQQALYDDLQANTSWHRIQGQTMAIATAVAPPGYEDEISSVAHRLREALSPGGLFVLVQIGSDVQLVARSAHENVDVSRVARALGGGGHDRAAAALIVGTDLAQVAAQVQRLLPEIVLPLARVAEIMSFGVQTIPADTSVAQAAQQMRRTGHEGFPVIHTESGAIAGLLTRNAVDRAMNHDLGDLPVSRVMQVGSVTVRPSESIERVQELMLREGWGQIPVLAEDPDSLDSPAQPIGIVTRTDLLNYWFQPAPGTAQPDMRALLSQTLPLPLWAMVLAVGQAAGDLGMPLYSVGGPVRDLLLQIPPTDLDMVVEGDAIALVKALQGRFGGEFHTHARFGTAKWFVTPEIWSAVAEALLDTPPDLGGERHFSSLPPSIDFVTARFEFYTEPTALPEVERGSIKLDLHRRDFTINTLAVRLDGLHLGELLDFYGGRRDLEDGQIRVLHSLSFVDDPTRILRAVRFEQRLGFAIEPRTLELIANALPMLSRVTGQRIRHELELALREADPLRVMERLSDLDVISHIQPGLTWTEAAAEFYGRVPAFLANPLWSSALPDDSREFLYFALWLEPLPKPIQEATARRLRVRRTTSDDVLAVRRIVDRLLSLPVDAAPSTVTAVCRDLPTRVLLAARIVLGDAPQSALLDTYYRDWRHIKTAVSGADLRALGLRPGPAYARILEAVLAARLDGLLRDEKDERALLLELLRREGAGDED